MAKTTDAKTMELIDQVKKQRDEIEAINKPNYATNMAFSYSEGRNNDSMNLHVQNDVGTLLKIAAFLTGMDRDYIDAANALGLVFVPPFKWQGFFPAEWISDIGHRIAKLQIKAKQDRLAQLEARLDKIISPELRAKMELEEIEKELNEG